MESNSEPTITKEQAIANLQQCEDPSLRYYAAWWLGKFRVREPIVIETLIAALADEVDRLPDGGYPLRRNAARALGKLGDRQAVTPLIECLDCPDFYVREAAAKSLGMLTDASCIPSLLKLLDGGIAAAVQIPGKPHLSQPYEAILEALGTLEATEAIEIMKPFLDHFVPKIQYAAARALYQLTKEDIYGMRLLEGLKSNNLALRRSVLMDLGAIGYINGAEAIAATLAENSLKLISLKGLLEADLANSNHELSLSENSIKVMELMDQLL